jgi:predicted dehydrogenase
LLDFPAVERVDSRLHAAGQPLAAGALQVEDYAAVQLGLAGGVTVRLTCSWRISAGRDAVIEAAVHGATGGVAMKNVGGSFYDFEAERYHGTRREQLAAPPDAWGGRAAVAWLEQLAGGARFDPACNHLVDVASVLDAIYRGATA